MPLSHPCRCVYIRLVHHRRKIHIPVTRCPRTLPKQSMYSYMDTHKGVATWHNSTHAGLWRPLLNLLFLLCEVLFIDWQAAQLRNGSTNYSVGSHWGRALSH